MWLDPLLMGILTAVVAGHFTYTVMTVTSPLYIAVVVGAVVLITTVLIVSIVRTVIAEVKKP